MNPAREQNTWQRRSVVDKSPFPILVLLEYCLPVTNAPISSSRLLPYGCKLNLAFDFLMRRDSQYSECVYCIVCTHDVLYIVSSIDSLMDTLD